MSKFRVNSKDLAILSLMIIPAIGFGLTLSFKFTNPAWYMNFNARVIMMFLCCLISGISFGALLVRKFKK